MQVSIITSFGFPAIAKEFRLNQLPLVSSNCFVKLRRSTVLKSSQTKWGLIMSTCSSQRLPSFRLPKLSACSRELPRAGSIQSSHKSAVLPGAFMRPCGQRVTLLERLGTSAQRPIRRHVEESQNRLTFKNGCAMLRM
jgi:hypothetical protein